MQLLTLERRQQLRLFYVLLAATVALVVLTAKQTDPAVYAAGVLLAIVSVFPFYFWLLGRTKGLPIWPVFCLVNGITAALPLVQDPRNLDAFTPSEIITGGLTWTGFIVLGTIVWLSVGARAPKPPSHVWMIGREHAERYLFWFVAAGLFFQVNQMMGWIPLPGNTMQIARGVAMSLNSMGIFVLSFYMGRGLLTAWQKSLLIALTAATCLIIATGLILASAVIVLAMFFLGYLLGGSRVPWQGVVAVFFVLAVLHAGKFAMRDAYWLEGRQRVTLTSVPAFYADWASHGFHELGGVGGFFKAAPESRASTIFERGGTIHMLLIVQTKTPSEVPFFNGLTYEFIPRLLIPRFLDDQKGGPHAANIMLTVNYGLQTLEQTQTTSIGWGLVPEAYANFGYIGVAAVAALVAAFYAVVANMTAGVPMTSLRFVIGLLIMAVAVRADTMALFVTMQFQSVVGVSLAALLLMRRQRNPFVENGTDELDYDMSSRVTRTPSALRRTRHHASSDDGTPAPGLLADLIEGEQESRNGGSAGPRDVGTGGTVRTLPMQTPKRIARWMPRRVRAAVAAAAQSAADDATTGPQDDGEEEVGDLRPETGGLKEQKNRPRQVAVPYRNYRRYRA